MIKKDKHQHKAPYSKVKIIEDLLIKSDLGKTKWHRIFGLCLVLRPYDNNGNTLVNKTAKHYGVFLKQSKKQSFFKRLRTAIWESIAINF